MTWKSIRYPSLARSVHGQKPRRALITWETEHGEMFVHGVVCAGPEKIEGKDAVYFYLTYDGRADSMRKWNFLPHPTYGFRPKGSDFYLSAQELGIGANALREGDGRVYFEVPTARRNKLKFYAPAVTPEGELWELPGDVAMYACMVEYGWRKREDWEKRIKDELWRKRSWDGLRHEIMVTDVLDEDTWTSVAEILKRRLDDLEMMTSEGQYLEYRKKIWQMWGLASRIFRLPYVDFANLLRDFDSTVYSVTAQGGSVEAMPWKEDREHLHEVAETAQDRWKVAEAKHFEKKVEASVDDDAWAMEQEMRRFVACGNPLELWGEKNADVKPLNLSPKPKKDPLR